MAKTIKTGYDGALDFDPASGIIKYGQYEFYADQVGVKPSVSKFTFDEYRRSLMPKSTSPSDLLYQQPLPSLDQATEAKLRADFAAAASSMAQGREGGTVREKMAPQVIGTSLSGDITNKGSLLTFTSSNVDKSPTFARTKQIDADTFEISRYAVPQDIEFINRLNAQAANLNSNVAQGQTTDPSRPTPGNARLGKPNYSRASSVLAGEQSPLGGAKTTLGS